MVILVMMAIGTFIVIKAPMFFGLCIGFIILEMALNRVTNFRAPWWLWYLMLLNLTLWWYAWRLMGLI